MFVKFAWLVTGLLVASGGVALVHQGSMLAQLRAEIMREKTVAAEVTAARAEHDRLLARQTDATEVARLTAQSKALAQARQRLASLQARLEKARDTAAEKSSAAAPETFTVGEKVSSNTWRNAGTASPLATLETALWAGAGGDVEAFSKLLLMMNPAARKAAKAMWENAPETLRATYRTPEELLAFFTVRDVPLGSAQIRQYAPLEKWPNPAAQMQVILRDAEGKTKESTLLFMDPGDGWKLVVNEAVIAKYAGLLKTGERAFPP